MTDLLVVSLASWMQRVLEKLNALGFGAMFELLGSKLHMSTADHLQTDGQAERANRVVADVLRTIATPKE